MEYNNPKQINNIVELCDKHEKVIFFNTVTQKWEEGTLIGIERFSGSFMFKIFSGTFKYAQLIKLI